MNALLDIRDLRVSFDTARGIVTAVDGVDLAVGAHECVGLVGESGSGKTQLMLASTGLVPPSTRVSGHAFFAGTDLLRASEAELDRIRGKRIGFVFQDPLGSLTPHLTIGQQIVEVLQQHLGLSHEAAHSQSLKLLNDVHMGEPERRHRQFPHELSGGLRQRAMIAIALAAEPELLIADEPTTALDVTIQAEILELLGELKRTRRLAIVLITHDFAVAATLCDRMAVLYAGRVVEQAPTAELFANPHHPYSRLLIDALPRLDTPIGSQMTTVAGQPPGPYEPRDPCAFAPRCLRADDHCRRVRPDLTPGEHAYACHHPHVA